jgi:hypothetical protein
MAKLSPEVPVQGVKVDRLGQTMVKIGIALLG